MKKCLLLALLAMLCSCGSNSPSSNYVDTAKENAAKERLYDSIARDYRSKLPLSLIDTNGLYTAPVKVLRASLIKRDYSNYRDIQLTYKNITAKTITGIKFKWFGKDAFGEPADMGNSILSGLGSGFMDEELRPNKTETSSWNILSRNGKIVVLAWPTEVAFKDGSKWVLSQNKSD